MLFLSLAHIKRSRLIELAFQFSINGRMNPLSHMTMRIEIQSFKYTVTIRFNRLQALIKQADWE